MRWIHLLPFVVASTWPVAAPSRVLAAPTDAKAEAIAHFEKGLSLFDAGAWDQALVEFLEARRLHPLRNAAFNAALCLEKLRRHDEALAMLEAMLREFGERMPADAKERVQRKLVELRGLVGALEIEGAEIGAVILVDGQARGEYPPLAPIRVTAGSHLVRVIKPGFEPFEERVSVTGGRSARVEARMQALVASGRLRVVEGHGEALEVIVDGGAVGKTPWAGQLPVGEHVVVLQGEGNRGTAPAPVSIERGRTTSLTLVAQELSTRLRVAPVPLNASVAIDSVTVGRGIWEGRLRAGVHRVEVAAPGFLPAVEEVAIAAGGQETLEIGLVRDPSSPFAPRIARWTVEYGSSVLLAPNYGGDVGQGLGGGGAVSIRAGHEWPSRLAVGLSLGWLRVLRTASHTSAVRPVDLRDPPELGPVPVTFEGALSLEGLCGGAWVGVSLGTVVQTSFRLGGGAMIGVVSDSRTGRSAEGGAATAMRGTAFERHAIHGFYLAPEVRVGVLLGRHVTLSAGLELLALFQPQPARWGASRAHPVVLSRAEGRFEYGTFGADRVMTPIQLVFAPGVSAHHDF
jgi:hypothetical protein